MRRSLGEHGFGLGDEASWWRAKAVKWLRAQGFGEPFDDNDTEIGSRAVSRATSPSPLTLPDDVADQLAIIPVHGV